MKLAFDCLKVKHGSKWVVTFSKWKHLLHIIRPKMSPVQAILYWRVLDEKEEKMIGTCFFLVSNKEKVVDEYSNKLVFNF